MTYLEAALTILTYADQPLTVGELTALAIDRGLIHPRGRTPDRSMSSALYRRMAGDPDAPITSNDARFWLRSRPLASTRESALHPAIRSSRRHSSAPRSRRERQQQASAPRTALPLPPPLALPQEGLAPIAWRRSGAASRATASLAERLRRFLSSHPLTDGDLELWDTTRIYSKIISPLLTMLGFRRAERHDAALHRGRFSLRLQPADAPALLLEIVRAGHSLSDSDARPTLVRASEAGIPWVLLSNGYELRLYSTRLAGGLNDPASAQVLRVTLHDCSDERGYRETAQVLWLLTRSALLEGALEAYLAARAVGATLLQVLEQPESEVNTALAEAVLARTGLQLPPALVARHARLAVRTGRTRDGAPLLTAIATAAAITPPPGSGQDETLTAPVLLKRHLQS